MKAKKLLIHSLIPLSMVGTAYADSHGLDWELYGSLRLAAETVYPDGADGYGGMRDAYTRFGGKATYVVNDDWLVMGQLEAPFDLANMDMSNPYDNDDYRIAKIQLNGPPGTLWYGKGWMAYYNYIAYPVDYFSSYYSGWATFTTFRRENTFYYASPSINGFQLALATSDDNGAGNSDNRNQFVLSYSNNGLNLAIGRDDRQENGNLAINGASATYTTGPWYIAAKYEELDYDAPSQYDGDSVSNFLVQYTLNEKNTLRGMIADVGWDYGDTVFHVGWDHKYNDDLKVFAEYYDEEQAAAIADGKNPENFTATGGSVFTVGVRYDFSTR